MSIKLMAECWTRQIPRSEREVLLVFCDHANDDGYNARPSIARIAWKTDVSERHIKRIVKELVTRGALRITRESSHDQPTTYRVVLSGYPPKPPFAPKNRGDTVSPLQIPLGVTSATEGVTSEALGVTSATGRGDIAMSPKPSVQPSKEPSVQPSSSFSCANGAEGAIDGETPDQRIRDFLSIRGINEPVRSELCFKFAGIKDGPLWLFMEFTRCTDPTLYKHKNNSERISMFVNRARTKWLSLQRAHAKSALVEYATN